MIFYFYLWPDHSMFYFDKILNLPWIVHLMHHEFSGGLQLLWLWIVTWMTASKCVQLPHLLDSAWLDSTPSRLALRVSRGPTEVRRIHPAAGFSGRQKFAAIWIICKASTMVWVFNSKYTHLHKVTDHCPFWAAGLHITSFSFFSPFPPT